MAESLARNLNNAVEPPGFINNAREPLVSPEAVEPRDADDLLDVGDLVRMFEESEDATFSARQLSERDRDYYDTKQLTAEEKAVLSERGQPEFIDNIIKEKIDYLVGLERTQRVDPKAYPRTPAHEFDADGATQALRYVADEQHFDAKRSNVWKNLLVEGAGGFSVSVEPSYHDELCVKLRRIAWDRMFWDPHSSETDFSDAGYLGVVVWLDYNDALAQYPEGQDIIDTTMATAPSDTYDDKPKFNHWADKKRKRIRVCQIWIKRGKSWHFAEFTKSGILKGGPSPYVTDQGESDCELDFQSAYVDRDNNRYGMVREMILIQDAVNKRHSKSLHLLNTVQVMYEDGSISDIEIFRKQAARPDGTLMVAPGALRDGSVKIETRLDLATTHFQLLQENKNSLDRKGPNATMMGEKAQGSSAASGKAIIASQQGGMIQLGDLLDNLRQLDNRVFRKIWFRIRQYWTAEKWIRITDDERNVKWVGMNVDPMQIQMAMQQNPEMQGKIAGIVQNVAELDCDIIIDEAPDSVTPQLEQWQGLVELAKGGVPIPPDVLVEAAPNLKNKDKLLERMKQPNPLAEQRQQIETAGAVAKVKETESKAALNMSRAHSEQMPDVPQGQPPQDFELPPQLQVARELAEIENTHANTDFTRVRTQLEPMKARQQAADRQARMRQMAGPQPGQGARP